jgi:hypothetical protein
LLPSLSTHRYDKRVGRTHVEFTRAGMTAEVPDKHRRYTTTWTRTGVVRNNPGCFYVLAARVDGMRLRRAFFLPFSAFGDDQDRFRFEELVAVESAWQSRWRSYLPTNKRRAP